MKPHTAANLFNAGGGAKLWNEVSDDIRKSTSLNLFKKRFKAFLIEDPPDEDDDQIYLFY